jgi:hypothetical protein
MCLKNVIGNFHTLYNSVLMDHFTIVRKFHWADFTSCKEHIWLTVSYILKPEFVDAKHGGIVL